MLLLPQCFSIGEGSQCSKVMCQADNRVGNEDYEILTTVFYPVVTPLLSSFNYVT